MRRHSVLAMICLLSHRMTMSLPAPQQFYAMWSRCLNDRHFSWVSTGRLTALMQMGLLTFDAVSKDANAKAVYNQTESWTWKTLQAQWIFERRPNKNNDLQTARDSLFLREDAKRHTKSFVCFETDCTNHDRSPNLFLVLLSIYFTSTSFPTSSFRLERLGECSWLSQETEHHLPLQT